jgi:hypothetical protein
MNENFLNKNYFEIFLCLAITTAGLYRLIYPELRKEEMNDLKINENIEYIIIIYELCAIYFLFYTTKENKNIYIYLYIIVCLIISIYYLSNKNILEEFKKLCIYTNDIKSIWCHIIYIFILIYIVHIK